VDLPLCVDDATAKAERRDVPFSGGPHAENEPPRPRWNPTLIGVPHERRIKQGRRLDGVFLREVGTDQQLAILAQRSISEQMLLHRGKAVEKKPHQPVVAAAKLFEDLSQKCVDLGLRQLHHAADDSHAPLRVLLIKGAKQHAGIIRLEDDSRPLQIHRIHSPIKNPRDDCVPQEPAGSAAVRSYSPAFGTDGPVLTRRDRSLPPSEFGSMKIPVGVTWKHVPPRAA
jgi:hypothetical protein